MAEWPRRFGGNLREKETGDCGASLSSYISCLNIVMRPLQPLPYHYRIRDYLKSNHGDVWNWFSSAEAESDFSEAVQLELLKATYRMRAEDHEDLYQLADEVKRRLAIDVPVTLYRSQDDGSGAQAMLYFTPGHGHVVFSGKILDLLDTAERRALIGHELAHFKLWSVDDGDFLVVDRILLQMAGDARSDASHFHSARLYRLYTEIYADRGCLQVSDSMETGVSTLIKVATGSSEVNPKGYLEQAEEVVEKIGAGLKSDQVTHPENFIRARAMQLWSQENEEAEELEEAEVPPIENAEAEVSELEPAVSIDIEAEIAGMIEGGWSLDELDLTRQLALTELTRELLLHLLEPEWVRTGRTLAHAKLFFSDFDASAPRKFSSLEKLAEQFERADEKTRHYLAHLLLDFSVADRDLDDNGLAQAFWAAEKLGLAEELEKAARKELKMLKRDVTALRKNLDERREKAAEEYQRLSKIEKAEVND